MSIKIYCEHCGAEIKDGEKFYEACLGEFYCKDCVKEQTLTYFTVDSEPIGTNEDTGIYFNHKQLKEEIEQKIKEINKSIEVYRNDKTRGGQFTFNFFKERKRLLEEKLQEFK